MGQAITNYFTLLVNQEQERWISRRAVICYSNVLVHLNLQAADQQGDVLAQSFQYTARLNVLVSSNTIYER